MTHFENRSLFFIHDKAIFDLIQPTKDGLLIKRRQHIPDAEFRAYPEFIKTFRLQTAGRADITLDADYWRKVHAHDAASSFPGTQLRYLFLAGFNQNIIDFMNQEASEILDSLDPIYPNCEEQEKEGFFVRYANPFALITYVPRSRTLEVGNDYTPIERNVGTKREV